MFGNLFYFLYLKFRVKDNQCICKYWYLILLPLCNCTYKICTHSLPTLSISSFQLNWTITLFLVSLPSLVLLVLFWCSSLFQWTRKRWLLKLITIARCINFILCSDVACWFTQWWVSAQFCVLCRSRVDVDLFCILVSQKPYYQKEQRTLLEVVQQRSVLHVSRLSSHWVGTPSCCTIDNSLQHKIWYFIMLSTGCCS